MQRLRALTWLFIGPRILPAMPRASRMKPPLRRAAIIHTAMTCLETNPKATIGEIAVQSGVTAPTVFKLFPTKAELIIACLEVVVKNDALEQVLRDAIALRDLSARLHVVGPVLFAHLLRISRLLKALDELSPAEERGAAQAAALRARCTALFREPRAGAFKLRAKPEALAAAFLDVLFTEAAKPTFAGYAQRPVEELVDLFLYGLTDLPRPSKR